MEYCSFLPGEYCISLSECCCSTSSASSKAWPSTSWSGKLCKNIFLSEASKDQADSFNIISQKIPNKCSDYIEYTSCWNEYFAGTEGLLIVYCYEGVLTPLRSLFEVSGTIETGNITHLCECFKLHFLNSYSLLKRLYCYWSVLQYVIQYSTVQFYSMYHLCNMIYEAKVTL